MPAETGTRILRAAGATDVGRQRDNNEDRFFVDADRGVFIVVDGIGGHAAGDRAADTAIAVMRERLARQTGTVPDRVREAITIANNEIHRLAASRPDWRGMACVLTMAVIDGSHAVVGHVGDSRLYKLQGGNLEKITPDHSPVGEREDARELSELEAMRHPRRNEVYRDVGSEPHEIGDRDFAFVEEIDLPADAALLICSDGLTDLVPSETIRDIAMARANSPEAIVRALIAAANEAGGKDNVTVVFVAGERFGATASVSAHGRRGWVLPFAIVTAGIAGATLGWGWDKDLWPWDGTVIVLGTSPPGAIVVRSTESIMAAIDQATPGTAVIVEPGEYRERLTLKDNVRVVSRVPRGATLRLPGVAAERDAAVVAAGTTNAELSGFRIVGDAATPLGVGVLAREATLRLVDVEISGATTAAIDVGEGYGLTLLGSDIHDNPGSALVVRTGAKPRIANTAFARNATSPRAPAAFVVERDAHPVWLRNVFHAIGPEAIAGTDEALKSSLLQENWFISARPAPAQRPAAGRGGRGR